MNFQLVLANVQNVLPEKFNKTSSPRLASRIGQVLKTYYFAKCSN